MATLIDILTVRELRFPTWASTNEQEAAFAKLSAVCLLWYQAGDSLNRICKCINCQERVAEAQSYSDSL